MPAKKKPNELYITRIFDAPVEAVWDAWVDPEKVKQWWGPRGFTLTTIQKDVRVGGTWTYTMHGPDGVDYHNKTHFFEVEKYSRLVYDHGGNDDRPPLFRVTALFSEVNGKTKLEMTMSLASAEAANEIKKFIKKAGGEGTWDRLAEFLSPTESFVIHRSFEAPIDQTFEMWANPKHLSHWLPPTGFTMDFKKVDFKPGGTSFYSMSGPDGSRMYGRANYIEIQKPKRIVYIQQFCDESGTPIRHPMNPTLPVSRLTTVTFEEEGPDQTRMMVQWQIDKDATPAEREAFNNAKLGMAQGWGVSLQKLEDYLSCGSASHKIEH